MKISIVIPVFNEAPNLSKVFTEVSKALEHTAYEYELLFVDDGSKDDTLAILQTIAAQYSHVKYISFSRNFGHQYALKAGLDHASGEAIITMDGDLQHPPALLPKLIELWENGNDIVYTIRKDSMEVSKRKKWSSNLFYNVLNKLSDIELEAGAADFRLMDAKVVAVVKKLKETDLFWRGLVKWIGFEQVAVEYTAAQRYRGKSKYTFKKMTELALKGITSFSEKPLSIATYIGFFAALTSVLYVPYVIISLCLNHPISGWASVIMTIVFFGGVQLIILGILGLYLGKVFKHIKQRPHYIIKDTNLVNEQAYTYQF